MTHDEYAREINEKQIKKKPKVKDFVYDKIFYCPICDKILGSTNSIKVNYCSNCGQAIQWDKDTYSDEEKEFAKYSDYLNKGG